MERLLVTTADGVALEAELDVPAQPMAAVVLAHPHPLYGGSMRTGVPAALFERLPAAGVAALRFNFRGVEGSSGVHDRGNAERLDVIAVIDALAARVPESVPLVVCGWSFGGDVSLCIDQARIAAWCPVAPPLAVVDVAEMSAAHDARRKHLLVPEHDQYSPPSRTEAMTATWTNTSIEVVSGTDHFIGGALGRVADAVLALVRKL